jgi:hypothetical protein
VLGTVPDVCKTDRNCNTSEIYILISTSVTLTYSSLLLLHGGRRRQVQNHGHRTLGLLFIVRAFFNDTITVAAWTGFHVRLDPKS